MDAILSWVKNGLLFTVMASIVLLLTPNKSYMKHISLVIGLLFILVMVHPIMELFHLDSKTYASYIEKFLMLEGTQDSFSEEHINMYEESVNIQLFAAFNENGYDIEKVTVEVDEEGNVSEVHISFNGEVTDIEHIEAYLKRLFGQEVSIYYENT